MRLHKLTDVRTKLGLTEPAARQYLDQLGVEFAPMDAKGDRRKVGVSARAFLALAIVAFCRKRCADVPLPLVLHLASVVFEGDGESLRLGALVKRGSGPRAWWMLCAGWPRHLDEATLRHVLPLARIVEDAAAIAGLDARIGYPKLAPDAEAVA